MIFKIYSHKNGQDLEEIIETRREYLPILKTYLSGKSLLVPQNYIVSEAILSGKKVRREDLKKLERALRHFDSVGASMKLYDWLSQHEDSDWVCFGKLNEEWADFTKWEV